MMLDGKPIRQPVTEAINHPIGHVTQALLNLCFRRMPNDNDLLQADIEPFFTRLCDTQVDSFRHGRVVLASRLISLFRVDQPWSERHLLPLLAWKPDPTEATAAWEGFLWSPRLYLPLLMSFKPQFLDTARHYAELGAHREQFASFLTYAALERVWWCGKWWTLRGGGSWFQFRLLLAFSCLVIATAIDFGQSRSCGFVPLGVVAHRKDGSPEASWASE